MGGIVAQLVIALDNGKRWNTSDIAAIITMSAPHSLSPARIDTKIEKIYRDISHWEHSREHEEISVLSICGGSTDSQIPSEICVLPRIPKESQGHHRRTLYTTSIPGVWTGVGHREIVWCHQVRWRVARAALDVGNAGKNATLRSRALYRWFPSPGDTLTVPPNSIEGPNQLSLNLSSNPFTVVASATLLVPRPGMSPHVYLIPVPKIMPGSQSRAFSLLIARGSLLIPPLAPDERPQQSRSFVVSLYECFADAPHGPQTPDPASSLCTPLGRSSPDSSFTTYSSQLLPLPVAGSDFPGKEGADESDAVIYFTASFRANNDSATWIAIRVEGMSDISGGDWLVAGFDQERVYEATLGLSSKFCTFSTSCSDCALVRTSSWKSGGFIRQDVIHTF
jgi:glycosylphosphatidylinositol deacylase